MIQKDFAKKARQILEQDPSVVGLAVAGSWLSGELDEYSDLDLILVTQQKISSDKAAMVGFASRLGALVSAFTGEHVGENRLLICLYRDPLLHVDIKFLTSEEFHSRVEDPFILFERDGILSKAIASTPAVFPLPDFQWIEDRFWTWVHYTLLKIGRGEYMEAHDFLAYLRMMVLGPLIHIKNKNLPRGVRKVETSIAPRDLAALRNTLGLCDRNSLLLALSKSVELYRDLRSALYTDAINLQDHAEKVVELYFEQIRSKVTTLQNEHRR